MEAFKHPLLSAHFEKNSNTRFLKDLEWNLMQACPGSSSFPDSHTISLDPHAFYFCPDASVVAAANPGLLQTKTYGSMTANGWLKVLFEADMPIAWVVKWRAGNLQKVAATLKAKLTPEEILEILLLDEFDSKTSKTPLFVDSLWGALKGRTKKTWENHCGIQHSSRTNKGLVCAGPCREHNPYAEINTPNGTYVCRACSKRV